MFFTVLIDVIIGAILLIGAILGAKRGFISTVAKPVKWFLALALAIAFSNTVAVKAVQPAIEAPITNQLSEYLAEKCPDVTADTAKDELPTVLKFAAHLVDVDIDNIEGNTSADVISEIVDKLALPVVHLIALILSFILIYLLSKIALSILIKILNGIFETGIISVVNRVFGLIFGAAFAFVIAWVLVVAFGYITNIPALADIEWIKNFNGGYLYDFFKKMSPLDLLLSF